MGLSPELTGYPARKNRKTRAKGKKVKETDM
jgi:hypothetical protein